MHGLLTSPLGISGPPGRLRTFRASLAEQHKTIDWSHQVSHYYDDHDLSRFGEMGRNAPDLWEKFNAWYQATFQEGSLTGREKALIALGVAHALQCPYCIDAWSQECLEKGSNLEQMTEAVHVAAAIRGGAALVHGVQMRKRNAQLSM